MKDPKTFVSKMYLILCSIVVIGNMLLVVIFLNTLYGQKPPKTPKNQPPVVADVATKQEDPVRVQITQVDNSSTYVQVINFAVDNNSEKPVVAITVVGNRILTSHFTENPLNPGDTYAGKMIISRNAIKPNEEVVLSIDFVKFADGSTWGLDIQKESERINGFVSGASAATEHIRGLVTGNDRQRLDRFLDQDVKELEVSAQDNSKGSKWKKGYRLGYKSVILILKRVERKAEVLQRKLNRVEGNLKKQKGGTK